MYFRNPFCPLYHNYRISYYYIVIHYSHLLQILISYKPNINNWIFQNYSGIPARYSYTILIPKEGNISSVVVLTKMYALHRYIDESNVFENPF